MMHFSFILECMDGGSLLYFLKKLDQFQSYILLLDPIQKLVSGDSDNTLRHGNYIIGIWTHNFVLHGSTEKLLCDPK